MMAEGKWVRSHGEVKKRVEKYGKAARNMFLLVEMRQPGKEGLEMRCGEFNSDNLPGP